MSQCWSCYWGWPEPVARIYLDAVEALGGDATALLYGPGHVVWGDENFDLADACVADCEVQDARQPMLVEELSVVKQSLQALAALPREVREVCPTGYDGEHPEQYPPSPSVTMIKVR